MYRRVRQHVSMPNDVVMQLSLHCLKRKRNDQITPYVVDYTVHVVVVSLLYFSRYYRMCSSGQ